MTLRYVSPGAYIFIDTVPHVVGGDKVGSDKCFAIFGDKVGSEKCFAILGDTVTLEIVG